MEDLRYPVRYFEPPEDQEHISECPCSEPKPWRPVKCVCAEIAEDEKEDREIQREKYGE